MGPASVNTLNADRLVFMWQSETVGIEKGTRARELARQEGPKDRSRPGAYHFRFVRHFVTFEPGSKCQPKKSWRG